MGYPTPIEWTDATWNPIGGCSIASPGCRPCYAQKLAGTRLAQHPMYAGTTTPTKDGKPVFNGKMTAAHNDHPVWSWPTRWRGAKQPKLGSGKPSLIFVGDMSDLFHEDRIPAVIARVIQTIEQSNHIGQLLTKRPDVMAQYFSYPRWTSNFWLGFSAERQKEFDERWEHMRAIAAAGWTVFCSYEPAIGPLVLPDDFLAFGRRAQVIAGGMSGDDDPAPAHPDWFRAVRDQCATAGVPFFFKQWGEWAIDYRGGVMPETGERETWIGKNGRCFNPSAPHDQNCWSMVKVGKKKAGRLLDGREWNEFPEVTA